MDTYPSTSFIHATDAGLMQQNGNSSGYNDDANFFNFDCDMYTSTNGSDTVQAGPVKRPPIT